MGTYRIVCTEQSDPPAPGHGHILAVGVGTTAGVSTQRLSVAEVRRLLDAGEVFYTVDNASNVALVRKFDCYCGILTIRSAADATTRNNLDNLPLCR